MAAVHGWSLLCQESSQYEFYSTPATSHLSHHDHEETPASMTSIHHKQYLHDGTALSDGLVALHCNNHIQSCMYHDDLVLVIHCSHG